MQPPRPAGSSEGKSRQVERNPSPRTTDAGASAATRLLTALAICPLTWSAGRIINNLRYVDDTVLMAENEEKLRSFLLQLKEKSEEAGLKLNIQKI